MSKKSELNEVYERLAELEGAIVSIEFVLLRHIAECNGSLRHHATCLSKVMEADINELPRVLPNEPMLDHLHNLHRKIRNIAAAYSDDLSDPPC